MGKAPQICTVSFLQRFLLIEHDAIYTGFFAAMNAFSLSNVISNN